MIIRANDTEAKDGRRPYPLLGIEVDVKHFVIRVTTPDNPFRPHKHDQAELWFIIDGEAVVALDGQDHAVAARDLIAIEPWVEHGLRVQERAEWICLG
jgi:mannose-6-phosphate isomerase-like protein (cupin superfamily)